MNTGNDILYNVLYLVLIDYASYVVLFPFKCVSFSALHLCVETFLALHILMQQYCSSS